MSGNPVIPAEAVEAAKRVAYERYGSRPDTAYLRTILEAAAPHMLAGAKADALEEAADEISTGQRPGFVSAWLRSRAATLRPTP